MIFLTVPGYTGSGAAHWQTWLEGTLHNVHRVEQSDWFVVDRAGWIAKLEAKVLEYNEPLVLVGHSCGAVSVAQWTSMPVPSHVVGSVLVAPADVDAASAPIEIARQRPLPRTPLRTPTTLVVSTNDPFLSIARAHELAQLWKVESIREIQEGGHLASADGFGPWPAILELLRELETR